MEQSKRKECQIFVLSKYGMTVGVETDGERWHIPYSLLIEWADKIKENYYKVQS